MSTKLYVGNLPYRATEEEITGLFEEHGEVFDVKIITDRETGRPRGFCFVEMENGEAAIEALNGKDFGGRSLRISQAIERERGGDRGRGNFNRKPRPAANF